MLRTTIRLALVVSLSFIASISLAQQNSTNAENR